MNPPTIQNKQTTNKQTNKKKKRHPRDAKYLREQQAVQFWIIDDQNITAHFFAIGVQDSLDKETTHSIEAVANECEFLAHAAKK
jgi:hypothetical protein